MKQAVVYHLYTDPPSTSAFTVEVAWRYNGTSDPFYVEYPNLTVQADGSLPIPAVIEYDETINEEIEIKFTNSCGNFIIIHAGLDQYHSTTTTTTI